MQDTMNFLPLEDYDNPKSPYYNDTEEIPFRIRGRRPAKIHRQMSKLEVIIQRGKDERAKLSTQR